MLQIKFTGVCLMGFSRSLKGGGKAKFVANWTDSTRKAMGWPELPVDLLPGASLEGNISPTSFQLQPADAQMKHHTMDLPVQRVHRFQIVRREMPEKRGKGNVFQLHFEAEFTDPKGCALLEAYMGTLGAAASRVLIGYAKQESLNLPEVQQDPDAARRTAVDNDDTDHAPVFNPEVFELAVH